jgi:phage replication initiation protein
MGGKSATGAAARIDSDESEEYFLVASGNGAAARAVAVPRPAGSVKRCGAFIDQVSFTVKLSDVSSAWVSHEGFARLMSERLMRIFGFGVTAKRDKGLNFYESAYVLGDGWGFLCVGGQRETFLVQVTGSGCAVAAEGWEKRLHAYLSRKSTAKITRLDIAYDDYEGKKYTVDQAFNDYTGDRFTCGGRPPGCEMRGNWLRHDGKGRTFYVGARQSGKLLRVYEKGRQLGGPNSPLPDWVRVECEWHSVDRLLPLEMLIECGRYLAGAYPALRWIDRACSRVKTAAKAAMVSLAHYCESARRSYGQGIAVLRSIYDDVEVLDMLTRPGVPRRLVIPDRRFCSPSWTFGAISVAEAVAAF